MRFKSPLAIVLLALLTFPLGCRICPQRCRPPACCVASCAASCCDGSPVQEIATPAQGAPTPAPAESQVVLPAPAWNVPQRAARLEQPRLAPPIELPGPQLLSPAY